MKEIIAFLRNLPAFYVATVDEQNKPRVRPFSFVMEWDGKLAFCTNVNKPTYRQLKNNPALEICGYDPSAGKWMRIFGETVFTTDVAAKRQVFEVMPELKRLYGDEQNPDLVCFYFDKARVEVYSFARMDRPEKIIEL